MGWLLARSCTVLHWEVEECLPGRWHYKAGVGGGGLGVQEGRGEAVC